MRGSVHDVEQDLLQSGADPQLAVLMLMMRRHEKDFLARLDPLLQFILGTKPDKPGKDTNYRGVTEFGGALYFTKGDPAILSRAEEGS